MLFTSSGMMCWTRIRFRETRQDCQGHRFDSISLAPIAELQLGGTKCSFGPVTKARAGARGLTNTFTVLSDLGRSRIVNPAVAQAVTRWLPRANQPSTSNPDLALLVRNDVQPVQEDIGTVRYDYHISDKASFFVRYNIHNASGVNPLLGVNSAQTVTERQQLGTISWTRIFDPTTTLNLRVGANRIASGQNSAVPDPGFVVSGIFSVSGSFLYNYANAYTYAGDYTHIRGRNTLLAGF